MKEVAKEMATAPAVTEVELPRKRIMGFNPNVFFLGLVSFFQDVSSEMMWTILPLFLANVLGTSTGIIGIIEGAAESTSTFLKILGGWLSDKLGARKSLTLLGYGLATVSKPFLLMASAWPLVLAIRMSDRVGKGIRTAPRDALIADSTFPAEMGKSFGFHRSMDTAGAFVGLALAALIVYLLQGDALNLSLTTFQALVVIAVVPAFGALGIIVLFVQEVKATASAKASLVRESLMRQLLSSFRLKGFDVRFKFFLLIVLLFTLGNSSDAFLILRAQNLGLSTAGIMVMLVLFNAVYTGISYPAGVLSDRLGRKRLIVLGWAVYALIYLGFGLAADLWQVWLLFVGYGVYYGATEGVTKALVADVVPSGRRGMAYGVYNAAIGVTAFPASAIAGWLWQIFSPSAPFFFGAALAILAAFLLILLPAKRRVEGTQPTAE